MADLSKWNKPTSNATSIARFGVFSNSPERKQRDHNASLITAIEAMSNYKASKGQTFPNVTINVADNAKGAQLKQVLASLEKTFRPQVVDTPTPKVHLPRLGNGG